MPEMTYTEIAKAIGISRQRVVQIEEVAIWKFCRRLGIQPPRLSPCATCKNRPRMPGHLRCLDCDCERERITRAAYKARKNREREAKNAGRGL